jgi:L-alanine-DL-glutamate epimerase-like enolase superfamily enzyme
MALWDIKGKALGLPVYKLLGGAAKDSITPYASLLPNGDTLAEYRSSLKEKLLEAQRFGFKAAKLEICINGPYTHNGLQEHDDHIADIVSECRDAVGGSMTLMVDVAYAWSDARTALRVLHQLEPYDLFFLETPINIDDLEGYAFLSAHSPIRIAACEWQNSHFEFLDLAHRGKLDVLQPDVGRVGGFTEARKVTQLAADYGRLVVPHCWKTGIGIAASAHLGVASSCCPYIEFLPATLSDSVLRDELVADELEMINGEIPLPQKPGLGIELNRAALEKYLVD